MKDAPPTQNTFAGRWGNLLTALRQHMRLDLGIGRLLPEWRGMLSRAGLREDIIAGITVACIAIPLSLAIALASSVEPAVGLVTAIIAGIVCALFGGTPLAVSGPAAAMAVLIATIVQENGVGGLLVVGLCCGVLQLLTGVLGFGTLVRFVPVPVITGFTAGIGALILIGQLPRALGLPPPDQAHIADVITHLSALLHETRPADFLLTLSAMGLNFGLPWLFPRLPAPLIAVVVPSLCVALLGVRVELIGEIPSSIPLPNIPTWPSNITAIASAALVVYALASLETLLSSSAIDKLAKGHRHDPNQEMVGQGIGNIAVSLFGGIPVTGVIVRSALNVQAGAKTRRSAIVHSLLLICTVYFLSPIVSRIPIAILAGTLLTVAIRMLHPKELVSLWKQSRADAVTHGITFAVILFTDLLKGIQAGFVAALIVAAVRLGKSRVRLFSSKNGPLSHAANGANYVSIFVANRGIANRDVEFDHGTWCDC